MELPPSNLKYPLVSPDVKILALAGRRYSGKSTIRDIVLRFDPRFRAMSFATLLKSIYSEMHGLPEHTSWTPQFKEQHRQKLIDLSWRIKQREGRYYFAEGMLRMIPAGATHIIVDDLRFLEELHVLLAHGAAVYKVWSEPHQRKKRGWQHERHIDEEYSETEMDLSSEIFHKITGGRGGTIFNTRDEDPAYVSNQVRNILIGHFPAELKIDE